MRRDEYDAERYANISAYLDEFHRMLRIHVTIEDTDTIETQIDQEANSVSRYRHLLR